MHYKLTPEAFQDLAAALSYLSERNAVAGEDLALSMQQAFQMLAKFPDAGRPRPEFVESNLRFWNVHRYFIAYKEESDHIEVMAIVHTSRDIPALLTDRFPKDTP